MTGSARRQEITAESMSALIKDGQGLAANWKLAADSMLMQLSSARAGVWLQCGRLLADADGTWANHRD